MAILYNSNYNETIPFSDVCVQIGLPQDTVRRYTVPGVATTNYQALFSYISTSNIFVCKGADPVVPTPGDINEQQYNEFRPEKRYVKGGDVLHFITPDADPTYVGLSLRQLNQT